MRAGAKAGGGQRAGLPGERLHQERLLDVEPVLGLFKSEAARTVENVGGDLLPAMGRQTVHRDGLRPCQIQQLAVDLEAPEGSDPG